MKGVIIQGSARSHGNTNKIVKQIQDQLGYDYIDLTQHVIDHYQYDHDQDDDFLPLMRTLVDQYDFMVLATPVYWYSMSGIMKTFLDRFTDCLKIDKPTGRKLRGKYLAALSCGSDAEVTPGYFNPFRLSAEYLGMHYVGDIHTWITDDKIDEIVQKRIMEFCNNVSQTISLNK